jgi:hypothetical protein
MLRSIKDLEDCTIGAADGIIGRVRDFYFDDEAWVIRYLVVLAMISTSISGNAHRAPRNHAIRFRGNTGVDCYHSSLRVARKSSPRQSRAVPTRKYSSQIGVYLSLIDLCGYIPAHMMTSRNRSVGTVPRLRPTIRTPEITASVCFGGKP